MLRGPSGEVKTGWPIFDDGAWDGATLTRSGTARHRARPIHERSRTLAPAAIRVHHHLPLPLSPAHDGAGVVPGLLEMAGASQRERERRGSRALLGAHLRPHLRRRRRHRHPDGVPVRHELGAVHPLLRRRDRSDAGDGGDVRVPARERVRRRAGVGRTAPRTAAAFPGGGGRRGGQLAVRLFHPRHQRLHAVSGRSCGRRRRHALHRRPRANTC